MIREEEVPGQESVRANVAEVMDIIERRTISFAAEELGLSARRGRRRLQDIKQLELRDLTALVAVGPRVDLYIAYSFTAKLIEEIAERFTADLNLPADEMPKYVHESACEMVNIIVGNSTAELADRGKALHLSPPVVLVGAKQIHRHSDAVFATVTLAFDQGELDIAFVGPQHLFDINLNYCGTSV